jgi:hypothetical protein
MEHVHCDICEECEREYYVIGFPGENPKDLVQLSFYHRGEGCALFPSYDDLFVKA